jgi:hypothetical protein
LGRLVRVVCRRGPAGLKTTMKRGLVFHVL